LIESVKSGRSNKLVVNDAGALTLEFKEGIDLFESVSLSLFSLCDDLRRRGGGGSNELGRSVRLSLRDQERLLDRSDHLEIGDGKGRGRENHFGLVLQLLFNNLFALLVSRLGSLVKSRLFLNIVHALSASFKSLKVGELLKVTAEAFEGAEVHSHNGSEDDVVHVVAEVLTVMSTSSTVVTSVSTPSTTVTFAVFTMSTSMLTPSSSVVAFTVVSSFVEVSSTVMSGAKNLFFLEIVLLLKNFFISYLSFRLNFFKGVSVNLVVMSSNFFNLGLNNRLSHLTV
jgi:hypothetical protein